VRGVIFAYHVAGAVSYSRGVEMKAEYKEGPEAGENFERSAKLAKEPRNE
jgi:hypothetical protein